MKKIFAICLFLIFSNPANARFTVFACESEWETLAREITGSKATIFVGALPRQDASNVKITSNLLRMLRKADMVFCSGGGLEEKWLTEAIIASKNESLAKSPESMFFAYDYAKVKPNIAPGDASLAHKAFPRVHLNPNNIVPIVEEFTRRASLLDQGHDYFYQKSYKRFATNWKKMTATWEEMALPLAGKKLAIFDDSWRGLADWLGLEVAYKVNLTKDVKENREIMTKIVAEMPQNKVDFIIVGIHEDQSFAFKFGKLTKTKVILLPLTAGEVLNAGNLQQLFMTAVRVFLDNCPKNSCSASAIKGR
jgi:zinc/manganese transport system substrate-binding protein